MRDTTPTPPLRHPTPMGGDTRNPAPAAPYLWLAAAVGATMVLAASGIALGPGLAWLAFVLFHVASLPLLAWFLALPRWTPLATAWPRPAWATTAVLAYLAVGLAYAAVRVVVTGGLGAWTVPLVWPSVAIADAGYAFGFWTGTVGN